MLTPFEKNIEVWRQLWRVLERSDIVVQVTRHERSHSLVTCRVCSAVLSQNVLAQSMRVRLSAQTTCSSLSRGTRCT